MAASSSCLPVSPASLFGERVVEQPVVAGGFDGADRGDQQPRARYRFSGFAHASIMRDQAMTRTRYGAMFAVRTGDTRTTGSPASNICPLPRNIATLWFPLGP